MTFDLLTEDWLRTNGFKWHQFDRQPNKHWLLWLGSAMGDNSICYEDIGIEVATSHGINSWFCWLRSDSAGRYHRFIHIRHIESVSDLVGIITGLTGRPFDPACALYGHLHTPERAARIREEDQRLDRRLMRETPWYDSEKDDSLGGALPEHLNAHLKQRTAGPL